MEITKPLLQDTVIFAAFLLSTRVSSRHFVNECPTNEYDWNQKGNRLNCSQPKTYHCLPFARTKYSENCFLPKSFRINDGCPYLDDSDLVQFQSCDAMGVCQHLQTIRTDQIYLLYQCADSRKARKKFTYEGRMKTTRLLNVTFMTVFPSSVANTSSDNSEKGFPAQLRWILLGLLSLIISLLGLCACLLLFGLKKRTAKTLEEHNTFHMEEVHYEDISERQ